MSKKAIVTTAMASTLAAAVAYGLIKYRQKAKGQQGNQDSLFSHWVSS